MEQVSHIKRKRFHICMSAISIQHQTLKNAFALCCSKAFSGSVAVFSVVYMCICVYICIHIYMYAWWMDEVKPVGLPSCKKVKSVSKLNQRFLCEVNPDCLPSFSGLQIPWLFLAQSSLSPTSPWNVAVLLQNVTPPCKPNV